jgi:hypothetical protein
MYFFGLDIDLLALELEARLAGGLGQGLDPAVEPVAAPVEHHHLDPSFQRALGQETAHPAGHILLGLALGSRRTSFSRSEAATRVRPAWSSMIWA